MGGATEIYTLRHGHTSYNHDKRYAGTIDIPLSERGTRETTNVAERFRALSLDVVVTSKLKRALQTVEILFGTRLPIIQTKLCAERNFGVMEGLTWEEVQRLEPPVLLLPWGGDLHTVNPRNGETLEQVWDRAKRFSRLVFNRCAGSKVMVVSHGVFLQMFHGLLRGITLIEALGSYPGNLELSYFRVRGRELLDQAVLPLGNEDGPKW